MSVREPVKCPTCAGIQAVDGAAVRYTCTLCCSEWTWAACLGCARLEPVLVGQESWKCSRCGRYTRSWWRSTNAPAEEVRIVRLRAELRTGRIRARAVAPRRRRRRVATISAAVLAVIGSAGALIASAGEASEADHDRAACVAFAEARSTIANGGMDDAGIRRALDAVRVEADQGSPPVAAAATNLVAAGRPGTATFLVATAEVVQACA